MQFKKTCGIFKVLKPANKNIFNINNCDLIKAH